MSTGIIIAIVFGVALLGIFALAFGSGGGVQELSYVPTTGPGAPGGGLLSGIIGGIL